MKKSLALILVLAVLIWAINWIQPQKFFTTESCPFCEGSVLEKQAVYRSDWRSDGAAALLNYKPAIPGHMLIIPERHVERFEEMTAAEMSAVHALIAKVDAAEREIFGATGYILLQKNGAEAGQSVPHVHFHYYPVKQGDSKAWLAVRMFLASWLKPLTEQELDRQRSHFQNSTALKNR